MNRALAIRTIQLLCRLPEFHIASCEMIRNQKYTASLENLRTCKLIMDDAEQLAKELKDLCETSAESTLDRMARWPSWDPDDSTPTST